MLKDVLIFLGYLTILALAVVAVLAMVAADMTDGDPEKFAEKFIYVLRKSLLEPIGRIPGHFGWALKALRSFQAK